MSKLTQKIPRGLVIQYTARASVPPDGSESHPIEPFTGDRLLNRGLTRTQNAIASSAPVDSPSTQRSATTQTAFPSLSPRFGGFQNIAPDVLQELEDLELAEDDDDDLGYDVWDEAPPSEPFFDAGLQEALDVERMLFLCRIDAIRNPADLMFCFLGLQSSLIDEIGSCQISKSFSHSPISSDHTGKTEVSLDIDAFNRATFIP